ncbi:MAG: ribonucleoside-diphosphate reductase subunit alpha [Coleofasciculaceae cyanobacterium RL_1_1]|nr:ribonucleoside-diphosphate reductase subunit alpha [Coleofasciculaceae cyanobacterium RL_1_1]
MPSTLAATSTPFPTPAVPASQIEVLRRDGTKTQLDVTKIRKVVNWACAGLDANPIELEAGLTTRLRSGVTTREIQDNLIDCALGMCSPQEPDWRYVAGRLHIWSLWKDTLVRRGYQYGNYAKTVATNVKSHAYDARMSGYSDAELEVAGSWINPDWDLDYDYAGAVLLTKRYLLDDELPQEALLTCALLLASPEKPENRLTWARRFYEAIATRKLSLATPILANLRVPGGSLSSCFITSMDDNLESIFETLTDTARISKNGGGVGVNVSRIRATGSWVMGKSNASGGMIPWTKLLNDTAIAVNQGGRRAGAVTVSLDVWHMDVPEFLECQTENGDQRRKAYDIFPQLVVTDEFMRRVEHREMWTLVDPYEVRTKLGIELAELWGEAFENAYAEIEAKLDDTIQLYKRIDARELFKEIMKSQVETGMPYLWFKDTANRANPNQHEGYIPGGNLCQESWSNVKPGEEAHTCNLTSLNLANIEQDELENLCTIAVRLLDNTIELTETPFQASTTHNAKYRTIGVGAMGLADWLAKRRLSYKNLDDIDLLFEDIGYHCTKASMELSKERGAYPVFAGSEWSKGHLIGAKSLSWYADNLESDKLDRWTQLSQDIQEFGIRNSHITAIAPNTSSSLVQGCTASILPTYSRFFYDKWAKGTVPIAPPFVKDYFWFYPENKSIDQRQIVKAVATMQKWIDTGISMELIFNLNAGVYFPDEPDRSLKAKDIFDTLILAWKEGCKAIYYIRTVQRDDFKESVDEGCTSCAN